MFMIPDSLVLIVAWHWLDTETFSEHYSDVIMGMIASQITSVRIVYTTVCSGADQRKHQSSASLTFVRGIHRSPVNSLHRWPVTPKMFPFDDVIMETITNSKDSPQCRQLRNTEREISSFSLILLFSLAKLQLVFQFDKILVRGCSTTSEVVKIVTILKKIFITGLTENC